MVRTFIGAGLVALACAVAAAPAAAKGQCFYGKNTFTVTYELSGVESGTVTEHVRDCGYKRVEVKETKTSVFGMTQTQSQRIIYDSDQIITVDNQTGQVTQTQNPMWQTVVDAMERNNQTGVSFGQKLMRGMGGRPTGASAKFAGISCDYWEVPQLSSTMCVTSWGATLEAKSNMAGMSVSRVATSVKLNDGGPASAFKFDKTNMQQTPNLGDIMKMMGRE